MPRKVKLSRAFRMTPGELNYLFTGDSAGDTDVFLDLECNGGDRDLWAAEGGELLKEWIADAPGSRPWAWWRFDSPKRTIPGVTLTAFQADHLREMRLHVGGSGKLQHGPSSTVLLVSRFGVPPLVDVDPDDPPLIESEASFLRRFGLFLPGEEKRVPADAYEPQLVGGDDD